MIKDIIQSNRYPIVFIGSGISKRYLKDFPNWNDLLKEYWAKIKEPTNFYNYMRTLKSSANLAKESESDKEFHIHTLTASYIQERFDDLFYNEEISISGLTIQTAYEKGISPFKFDIANRFKTYEIKEEYIDELKSFKLFLSKAKVIVTTNYDPFIENLLEEQDIRPSIFVGQKGFFDQTNDWGELFKIHGDINDPNSIIITEEDYVRYDNNSILISAKILVNMIEAPIMFLGYSLSDRNVRKLLSDFASQLPNEDIRKTINRISIIDYSPNEERILEEMMRDHELDIGYLLIKTDNYKSFYEQISTINEGLSPHEVLRYQKAIKDIVISAGSKGKLDSVLVSPNQMEDLEEQIREGKNIVVALGNKKNIFVFPDIVSYIQDYIFNANEFLPTIALTFAAKDGNKRTKTPFRKYLKENEVHSLGLSDSVIKKLKNKINESPSLNHIIDNLSSYYKKEHNSLEEIERCNYNQTRLVNIIIYNIHRISPEDLDSYIKKKAFPQFAQSVKNSTNIRSDLRKLFYAYDLLVNGDHEIIDK